MFTRLRSLDAWGAIASILGFIASICMIVLSDFKVAALISLLLAETIAILVWWHYIRKRTQCVHPYDREEIVQFIRYAFDSPTKMTYELTEVFRVTTPVLTSIPVTLNWSGSGKAQVRSHLTSDEIGLEFNGQTGELKFALPLTSPKRFGDIVMSQFAIDLEDTSQKNIPHLGKNIKKPCEFVSFEVVLRYRDTCAPANFEWLPSDNPTMLLPSTPIRQVEFDSRSRSFRAAVYQRVLGRLYRLVWHPTIG
jgi:hypothetical protein